MLFQFLQRTFFSLFRQVHILLHLLFVLWRLLLLLFLFLLLLFVLLVFILLFILLLFFVLLFILIILFIRIVFELLLTKCQVIARSIVAWVQSERLFIVFNMRQTFFKEW